MTLKMRAVTAVLVALVISATAMVACGGPSTTSIIQTTQAEEQQARATRTAEARLGGTSTGRQMSAAERAVATISAQRTAEAQNAGTPGTGNTGNTSGLPYGDLQPDEVEGEPQSGEVTVKIGSNGVFDPEMVKVTVGTTVTWETEARTATSTVAYPDQAESWNSGAISKQTFATEPARFSHTFQTPGCFQYRSAQSGQSGTGAVCVVE